MKYGFCLNHPNKVARNAKRLCDTCTKERHERSAASKGMVTKSARNNENIAISKTEDGDNSLQSIQTNERNDGADNTRRNTERKTLSSSEDNSKRSERDSREKSPFAIKKTKIKPRSDKNRELIKKELLVFKKIWESRPHFCEVTGKPIHAFDVRCFSHVLTKGAYPKFRLYEKNIVLCLPEKHHEWEFETRKTLELSWIEALESALKREYYVKANRF